MSERSFAGSMILIGIAVFLVVSMIMQSCQTDYKLMDYVNSKEQTMYVCCHDSATGYDQDNDVCTGAIEDFTEPETQKDFLDNIRINMPQVYVILVILMLVLAVLGVIMMTD